MTRYLYAGGVLLALIAAITIQSWRLDRSDKALHDANQLIAAYREAFRLAKDDAQTTADQCLARVNEARASAQRIETIIEREVPRDPNGCPYRPLLSGDELRQTLQPNIPPTEPVH